MNCNLMQYTGVRGRLSGTYLHCSRCLLQYVTGLLSLNKLKKKCINEFFEITHIIRHKLWFFIKMCVRMCNAGLWTKLRRGPPDDSTSIKWNLPMPRSVKPVPVLWYGGKEQS